MNENPGSLIIDFDDKNPYQVIAKGKTNKKKHSEK